MSNPYVNFQTSVLDANVKVITFDDDYKLQFGTVVGVDISMDSIKKTKVLNYRYMNLLSYLE